MPVDRESLRGLAESYGDYAYHDTRRQSLEQILSSRMLRPPTHTEAAANWSDQLRGRPGCVYLRLPVPQEQSYYNPKVAASNPLRVRLDFLQPDRFLIDEDCLCQWLDGRDQVPWMPDFVGGVVEMPRSLCAMSETLRPHEVSRGEWLDAADDDRPSNVLASAHRGCFAYRGTIPGDLLELNLEHRVLGVAAPSLVGTGWRRLSAI